MRIMLVFLFAVLGSPAYALSTFLDERPDGTNIEFHLDHIAEGQKQSLLLMLQGSGCDPVSNREWLTSDPKHIAPNAALLVIEKYGVGKQYAKDRKIIGCSQDYWDNATISQRVADAVQIIAKLRSETWWDGRLIIYGGSEGGAVAAILAPLVPETNAIIIQSSGIGVSVGDLVKAAVPAHVKPLIVKAIAEAQLNPTGQKRAAGASYSWWADASDIVAARALLRTHAPVLLIHGTNDESALIETARSARDIFEKAGKTNARYVEYEGYDHHMTDANGVDHQADVLRMAGKWVRSVSLRQVSGGLTP